MRVLLTVSFVLFGLVLLTTVLHIIWPNLVLFTLSLVFLANHLSLAHGALLKFQILKTRPDSSHAGCSKNVALSYLGLIIVVLASLAPTIGGADIETSRLDSGNGAPGEEFASIGQDGGALGGEDAFGAGAGADGIEQMGSGKGEGTATGSGADAEGFDDPAEGAEAEDPSLEPVEMADAEEVPEPAEEVPAPEEKEGMFLKPRPDEDAYTLAFDPTVQVPVSTKPTRSRPSRRGGAPSFRGPMASIDGSGTVVRPDKDTSILIFFDSSGSMDTTFAPLQAMRDTLLRDALLPCYGSVELYEEKVRVISESDERGLAWLLKGFESRKSIVFIFQDESESSYYDSAERYKMAFMPDVYNLRKAVSQFDGTYYRGVLFQVKNEEEGSRFQRFLRKTFDKPAFQYATFGHLARQMLAYKTYRRSQVNPFLPASLKAFDPASVPPQTPTHFADYYKRSGPVSFDVKFNVPEGSPPEYYLERITLAAKRLGIDLSGGEPG